LNKHISINPQIMIMSIIHDCLKHYVGRACFN